MAQYQSDFTHFLTALKAERPTLEAEQRKGRAIWWDKEEVDLDQSRRMRESRVPMQAYPYQTKS
jgi:hypothetical protein